MALNRKGETPKFLAGWKDIASYLGKGVRTVQRYEHEMGLPVRRPAAKSRAAVVATKAELDAWVAASPYRSVFSLPKTTIADNRAPARGITEGILEMVRLRDQMMELREELRSTLQTLQVTVENIHLKSVPPPVGGRFPLRMLIGETKPWLT